MILESSIHKHAIPAVPLSIGFYGLAFVLFLVGCSRTPTPSPSPVGTWVTTVTQAEIPTGAGQYEVTFADNGRTGIRYSGALSQGRWEMRYAVTQDRLVLTDELGSCVRVGFPTGTYQWSIENDTLTLTPIDDACYYRRKLVEGGRSWSRGKMSEPLGPTTAPMLK